VFCPRGQLLGPNVVRLPRSAAERGEVALTFDDGPDPLITPRVLDLLDSFGMKATFFCVGRKVCAHQGVVEDIVRRGHAVENHSFEHIHWFAMLDPWRMSRDIESAQQAIGRVAGERPRFFRAPNGFRNPWLDALLAKGGLRYVSWTRRGLDTVRRDPGTVARALAEGLRAGDVLLMHDGNCGRTVENEPMVLAVLPMLLERLRAHGLKSVALRTALETH
jgi:peptidoglycan/xylan/chitin deacetylase (PgdA/CDA1 family)